VRFNEEELFRAVGVGIERTRRGVGKASRSGTHPTMYHHTIGALCELAFGLWFPCSPALSDPEAFCAYDHILPTTGARVQVKATTSYPPRLVMWAGEEIQVDIYVLVHVFANEPGAQRPVPFEIKRDWRARIQGWLAPPELRLAMQEAGVDDTGRAWRLHRNYLRDPLELREIAGAQAGLFG
jgi:hypothetical protein